MRIKFVISNEIIQRSSLEDILEFVDKNTLNEFERKFIALNCIDKLIKGEWYERISKT